MRFRFIFLLFVFACFCNNIYSQKKNRPKVGVVLSGGGAKGFAHIGVLKVLTEAGLKVDYIGGTSMGGIIGGLYSIGYSPDSLASLVRSQDWEVLLTDKIPLRYVSIEEKLYDNKYFFSFPFRNNKISLPKGYVTGQNINMLLRRLTSPVYDKYNFKSYPIPFVTVATNIVDGSPLVIHRGDLAEALRATMSIPSFFTPVDYQGTYVVDGGIVDNYPVQEVKKLGADIIIGVDVQSPLYKRDELNSLIKVIGQTNSFYSQQSFVKNKNLTDIYIHPDITGYGMLDFKSYDTLIARGERAAYKALPKVKALIDSLNRIYPEEQIEFETKPLDSLLIRAIVIHGLEKVPQKVVTNDLRFTSNQYVTISEIEKGVRRLYGSGFFDLINYKFIPSTNGVILDITVAESRGGIIGLGLHFDSYYDVGILASAIFKNSIIKGSNTFVNFSLGKYPYWNSILMVDRGYKAEYGAQMKIYGFELYEYRDEKKKNSVNFTLGNISLIFQSTFSDSFRIGVKTGMTFTSATTNIGALDIPKNYNSFFNLELFYRVLTTNDMYFPTKGVDSELKFKIVDALGTYQQVSMENNRLGFEESSRDAYLLSGKFKTVVPISNRFAILPSVYGGLSIGKTIPPFHDFFFLGGTNSNYFDNMYSFTGLDFGQKYGLNALASTFEFRYRLSDKSYVSALMSGGNATINSSDLFRPQHYTYGYGLSYSYNSYIGPMELKLMSGNETNKLLVYINIGFAF
ncbi:MAG: patatin-like phospholipase family protein [Hyphomicrobiales bacterium]